MIKRPNLSKSKLLCIDIETKDPNLLEKGNGVFRNDGYILGVAISDGTFSEYYNLDHDDIKQEEKEANEKYLKDVLALPCPKLGQNFLYDIDWLQNWKGWNVKGKWNDTLIAEALINEYRTSYSLESLAGEYLGEGKVNRDLYQWCKDQGLKVTELGEERKWLWKMKHSQVKPYAIGDVDLTMRVFKEQQKKLTKEHLFKVNGQWEPQTLEGIYDIEIRSQPMLIQMRKNGVRIDKDRLIYTGIQCQDKMDALDKAIESYSGKKYFNANSPNDMQGLFKRHDIPILYNPPTQRMKDKGHTQGNPCFNKARLKSLQDKYPIVAEVLSRRHYGTIMSLFVKPYPGLLVGDRLHSNFYPTKRDEGGTVTGRFSGANPNLQQVSSKKEIDEKEFMEGQIIRKCFIPEEGKSWFKNDWNQIEYRLISHYAIGEGADEIRAKYNEDPDTDYHNEIGHMSGLMTMDGDEDERKLTKNLNFGTAYEMGPSTMAVTFGWDIDYAYEVYNLYHKKVPFIKTTSRAVSSAGKQRGFIKTILGRHCHVPPSFKYYVMFNRLIQGSAADIMKKAMVDSYEAGIFDTDHLIPSLTVHDELDGSVSPNKHGVEALKELTNIMETCVKLKVPIKCDSEVGENWGELESFDKWAKNYE